MNYIIYNIFYTYISVCIQMYTYIYIYMTIDEKRKNINLKDGKETSK